MNTKKVVKVTKTVATAALSTITGVSAIAIMNGVLVAGAERVRMPKFFKAVGTTFLSLFGTFTILNAIEKVQDSICGDNEDDEDGDSEDPEEDDEDSEDFLDRPVERGFDMYCRRMQHTDPPRDYHDLESFKYDGTPGEGDDE